MVTTAPYPVPVYASYSYYKGIILCFPLSVNDWGEKSRYISAMRKFRLCRSIFL